MDSLNEFMIQPLDLAVGLWVPLRGIVVLCRRRWHRFVELARQAGVELLSSFFELVHQ